MRVDLLPYDGFPEDWEALDPRAKKSIGLLLKRLQEGPYKPDLQEACELESGERYAYKVPEGYVVYWTILSNSQYGSILPKKEDVITVKLTGIRRLKT